MLVVLSGGMDRLVKVHSAVDGDCPVTMQGHDRGKDDASNS